MREKKKVLHILKSASHQFSLEFIQHSEKTHTISVILIQDAVAIKELGVTSPVFVLKPDLKNQSSPYKRIEYKTMLEMIFEADSVVTW